MSDIVIIYYPYNAAKENIVTMTSWSPTLAAGLPRYIAIAESMHDDLLKGVLKPGDRLPTHRDLAYRLGVTTGTVTRAYAEAERMGILVGEVGRGSFLKEPETKPPLFALVPRVPLSDIDLTQAAPPAVHDGQHLDWALRQIMASPDRASLLDYAPPEGHAAHRAMGAAWLARSGITVSPEHVIVTAGARAALISCLAALSQNGERVFVEGLNYPTLRPILRHLGLTQVPLELDDDGLVPESLERAARAGEARTLYLEPTLQNPTTSTLPLARRLAIVDIARRYGITIIEDDIFRLLDPRLQPPTLYTLAPERTYHVNSISKTLSPGLRVGFIATPPGMTEGVIRQQAAIGGNAAGLAAETARHWIESGVAAKIIDAVIAENAARRELALAIFRGRNFKSAPGATFIWLSLPDHWRPAEFTHAALAQGIRITPGPAFAADRRANDQAVRICYGGTVTREELQVALLKLNTLLDEQHVEDYRTVA